MPNWATYLQRAEVEMNGWRLKLHDMEDDAEAMGQATATAAETDLRTAWSPTKVDPHNLGTATAAG